MKTVFSIVPAFNEAPEVLVHSVVKLLSAGYRVIVVDDGSALPLRDSLRQLPVFYLRHPVNLGQGAALQTGTEFALSQGASIVVHFDGDGQHRVEDISPMVEVVGKGQADVALGSRFLRRQDAHKIPLLRKTVLQGARFINFFFTGILLSDAHQGLRVLNRKAAKAIVLTENREAHATQLLAQLKQHRLQFRELPVTVDYTAYSREKGQGSGQSFSILVDLILSKIFK